MQTTGWLLYQGTWWCKSRLGAAKCLDVETFEQCGNNGFDALEATLADVSSEMGQWTRGRQETEAWAEADAVIGTVVSVGSLV